MSGAIRSFRGAGEEDTMSLVSIGAEEFVSVMLVLIGGGGAVIFGTLAVAFHPYRISPIFEVVFSGLFFVSFVFFQIAYGDYYIRK